MFNSMQEPLAGANRVPSKLPAINHFLIYFLFLAAGVPLSFFVEVLFNPHAQSLVYWSDVNKDAQIPHAAVKVPEHFNKRKVTP